MEDFKNAYKNPCFQEVYTLVGGIEEQQDHGATWVL